MTLIARGSLYLGGVRFTTDPGVYQRQWPKRASKHPGIGGSITIQDFGRFAKDMTLTLQSGQHQLLESSVVESLEAMASVRGATYTLTDWSGNELTVFIVDFRADQTFVGSLCTYAMELHVLGVTKLFGATYTGS